MTGEMRSTGKTGEGGGWTDTTPHRDGFPIGVGNDGGGMTGRGRLGVEHFLGGGLEVGAEVWVGDVY